MVDKKVIVVIDPHAETLSLGEFLENESSIVSIFYKESEIIHFLEINKDKKGIILLDPRLPTNFLDLDSREISRPHLGEVGYAFIENIKDSIGNLRVIFYTTLSKYELVSVGFKDNIEYYQKPFCPIMLGKKIEEIC